MLLEDKQQVKFGVVMTGYHYTSFSEKYRRSWQELSKLEPFKWKKLEKVLFGEENDLVIKMVKKEQKNA